MSLSWAARSGIPRLRQGSLGAASQTILSVLSTRTRLYRNIWSSSATSIMAYTSAFSAAARPDLFLHRHYRGLSSAEGRGIPDISAQALNYFVVLKNQGFSASGTSSAAPVRFFLPPLCLSTQPISNVQTVAGIISLLNDYMLSRGKQPLGFLNPFLYGLAVVGMNDITSGSNPGCKTEGFSAIKGWDPVRTARLSLYFRVS